MWHEARRQEKSIRRSMVDASKRGEKRRRLYDQIRADPDQFMQLHGRKATIFTDANVAKAAEDSNVLRSWQGDSSVKIDRFDVRSLLDHIPAPRKGHPRIDSSEEKMEILCDFERYRILIINEFRRVGEKDYLKKIAEREYWDSSRGSKGRGEADKKRKLAEKKAAIAFSYDESDTVKGRDEPSDSESEEEEEPEDVDVELDTSILDAESARRANRLGESYGVSRNSYVSLQEVDTQTMRDAAELKQIEREKLALAGKEAKGERRKLKARRQLIVGRGCNDDATVTLLGMIGANEKGTNAQDESESSSDSDGADIGKTVFIRSLDQSGKVEEDEGEGEALKVQGPSLPNEEYRRILNLRSAKREESPQPFQVEDDRKKRNEDEKRRRERSRSRDRRRRSVSRDRRRTRSRSRDRRRRYSRSRSRDRKRRRSRSSSREKGRHWLDRRKEKEREEERRRKERSDSRESCDKVSDDGDEKMLSIHSSMSEDEKERREIENRKKRIKKTKKMIREKAKGGSKSGSSSEDEDERERKKHPDKMRQRMQKNLKRTVERLREEEEGRKREQQKAVRERESALYVEETMRRERERKLRRDRRSKSRS